MYKEADTLAEFLLDKDCGISSACNELGIDFDMFVSDYNAYDVLLEQVKMCDGCGYWHKRDELNNLCGELLCNDCLDMEVHQD